MEEYPRRVSELHPHPDPLPPRERGFAVGSARILRQAQDGGRTGSGRQGRVFLIEVPQSGD